MSADDEFHVESKSTVSPRVAPAVKLQYASPGFEADRRLHAQRLWKNDGRLGCFTTTSIGFVLLGMYCSMGQFMPHPAVAMTGGALMIAGVGLYGGLKDGAWGFLGGVGAATGLALALCLLVYSICG